MAAPICDFLTLTPQGLYCEPGRFHIDPWQAVERAVVTHAHSDHARAGCGRYLVARSCEPLLLARLGRVSVDTLDYGRELTLQGVRVSLHPAGHILGSAQVRLEYRGRVCVVTGDYKRQADPTCEPFESLACHTLVTESTFGLPIYRWDRSERVVAQIEAWWRGNQQAGKASVLFAYALGKSQRILASLDPAIGPVVVHGAIWPLLEAYRRAAVVLPPALRVQDVPQDFSWAHALILAPPSARDSAWLKRFGPISTAMASGWMLVRGSRRRRAVDRGFVLSDHADWPELLATIDETACEQVWITHGYAAVLARYLGERGRRAEVLESRFAGEALEESTADAEESSELVESEQDDAKLPEDVGDVTGEAGS